jgi:nitrogen fixation/metabolism regulation signal transduction histidine kinase
MNNKKHSTDHAPAERASEKQIDQDSNALTALPLLRQLLDSIPDIVFILNEQRQIVFANHTLVEAFNIADRREIYGLRPGEALQCIHAYEPGGCGCGTTSFCRTCGAVDVILSAFRGKKKTEECRISQKNTGNAFDLRVVATPYQTDNGSFVIFVATDISHEKRRNVLERTFFHDITNTLTGIVGYAKLLHIFSSDKQKDILEKLSISLNRLQQEIDTQKGLVSAECGDLSVNPQPVRSRDFLHEMVNFFKRGSFSSDSLQIDIDNTSIDIIFVSDKTLLSRVFGNMLKNAIEASQPNDKVIVGCRFKNNNNNICFWVQNSQFIQPDIQLQIFRRSFSTKGKGRGIGTYSMKLFAEKYLKGRVAFSTAQEQGTVFSVTLPLLLE